MDVKKGIATLTLAGAAATGVMEGTAPVQPVDTVAPNEILSKRTATTQVIDAGNGQRIARVHTRPIHYRDGKSWKRIDTSVKKRALLNRMASRFDYATAAGPYRAYLDSSKISDYRMEADGVTVEYTALFEGHEVTTETTSSGVKQTVTVEDERLRELRWTMNIDGGKRFGNRITSVADGKLAMTLQDPAAWDANRQNVPVTMQSVGDTLVYRWEPDAETVWPVYVDPSTTVSERYYYGELHNIRAQWADARDGTVASNTASYSDLNLGMKYSSSNYYLYRPYLAFDIPDVSDITDCTLRLYGDNDLTYDGDFDIYVLESWYADGQGGYDYLPEEAAWNDFDGWLSSGTYEGTVLNDSFNTSGYDSDGWNEIDLNSSGVTYVSDNTNSVLKFAILSDNDYNDTPCNSTNSTYEYITFLGTDNIILGTKDPELVITYAVQPPTNVSATDGTYGDKVRVSWTAASGATSYYVYRDGSLAGTTSNTYYDDTGAGAPSFSAGSASASDGTYEGYVRLTQSGESLTNGTSHSYTVKAYDGALSDASSANIGYRGAGGLSSYQWQRSSGDAASDFSNISGGTTDPYDDTGGPDDESGRYYRCYVTTSTGLTSYTTSDRGYAQQTLGTPTIAKDDSAATSISIVFSAVDPDADSLVVDVDGSYDGAIAIADSLSVYTATGLTMDTSYNIRSYAKGTDYTNSVYTSTLTISTASGWSGKLNEVEPSAVNGLLKANIKSINGVE